MTVFGLVTLEIVHFFSIYSSVLMSYLVRSVQSKKNKEKRNKKGLLLAPLPFLILRCINVREYLNI